jgi:large subunit ribosomal protein L18
MNRLDTKRNNEHRRQNRVRTVLRSASDRPRLSVHVSNKNISAQIIDDSKNATIVAASTVTIKSAKGTMSEKASTVGSEIAKQAKAKKIKKVAFDRGAKLYHGRIKALAEAARKEGLEF